jgi:hypothetical protein
MTWSSMREDKEINGWNILPLKVSAGTGGSGYHWGCGEMAGNVD